MIKITKDNLKSILETAFDTGKNSTCEERDDLVKKLMALAYENKSFKNFSLEDLLSIPIGKKILHPLFGSGVVLRDDKKHGVKFNDKFISFNAVDEWHYPISTEITVWK